MEYWGHLVTQGGASLALGCYILPLQGKSGFASAALRFASCPAFAGMTIVRGGDRGKSAWGKRTNTDRHGQTRTDTDEHGQNKWRAWPGLPGFAMTGDEIAALRSQ
jgi:hypothetical protein